MGKRKATEFITQDNFLREDVKKLKNYQCMPHEECKQLLINVLDNRSSCEKFKGKGVLVPTCHNMVTTMHVKSSLPKIDLAKVARTTSNSTYDRKRFAAITLRIENPKTTALLFSSGKVVITGATSRQMSKNHIQADDENTKGHGSHRPTPFKCWRHNRIQVFA